MDAKKCRWCATYPCPYPTNKDFLKQYEHGGQKWLKEKPCWTPIAANIGKLYTEDGQLLQDGYNFIGGSRYSL